MSLVEAHAPEEGGGIRWLGRPVVTVWAGRPHGWTPGPIGPGCGRLVSGPVCARGSPTPRDWALLTSRTDRTRSCLPIRAVLPTSPLTHTYTCLSRLPADCPFSTHSPRRC